VLQRRLDLSKLEIQCLRSPRKKERRIRRTGSRTGRQQDEAAVSSRDQQKERLPISGIGNGMERDADSAKFTTVFVASLTLSKIFFNVTSLSHKVLTLFLIIIFIRSARKSRIAPHLFWLKTYSQLNYTNCQNPKITYTNRSS